MALPQQVQDNLAALSTAVDVAASAGADNTAKSQSLAQATADKAASDTALANAQADEKTKLTTLEQSLEAWAAGQLE